MNNKNIKRAFTLAEVLVTLGVIGVVAVLTVPNLVSNYQKKVYVAQLQKIYNQVSNAVALALVEDEVESLVDTVLGEEDGSKKFLKKYFKIAQDCGNSEISDMSNCISDTYTNISKSEITAGVYDLNVAFNCVKLNSGATLCLSEEYQKDDEVMDEHAYWYAVVDINGTKKPNVLGRDYFGFELYTDGVMGAGHEPEHRTMRAEDYCNTSNDNSKTVAYGYACMDKVINAGWKMDY